MSALQVTARRHALIRKGRASYHAAVRTEDGWRTACGELLRSELHRPVNELDASQLDAIVSSSPALVCKRCDRVGSVLL